MILNALAFTTILFLTISCKEDENFYSCDPEINDVVNKDLKNISTMTRTQWLNLDGDLKKPYYSAFSPGQKAALWIAKIDELCQLNWSEKELNHIMLVKHFIQNNENTFAKSRLSLDELDKLELFIYTWNEYAREVLNWNKSMIYSIFGTAEKVISTDGSISQVKKIDMNITSKVSGRDCQCSQRSDYCDIFGETNGVVRCRDHGTCKLQRFTSVIAENNRCGFLWDYECNGMCIGTGW